MVGVPDNTCNVCGSTQTAQALVAGNRHGRHDLLPEREFVYRRCSDCGNLFLTGVTFDSAYYATYYPEDYYSAESAGRGPLNQAVRVLARYSHARKRRLIVRHTARGPGRLRILDIGCGAGEFLAALPPAAFDRVGLEINPNGVAAARSKGVDVIHGDIRSLAPDTQPFDIVTLWHVLEHVPDPAALLAAIRRIKKDSGVIVFAVPNTESLGFKLGGALWFHLDAPRHVFLPRVQTMHWLLRHCGYRELSTVSEWYDFPLDLFWSVRQSPVRPAVWAAYPVVKRFSRETITIVAR